MADCNSDILFDSVRFVLSNWPVLKLAVEHGFGGADSGEKAEWLVGVVDQVLRENGIIENYELEDYMEEILFNEFHTTAEDGSLPKVVQKLCTYQRLWKEGNAEQIQQELSLAPITRLPQFVEDKGAVDESDSDDDDDNDDRNERGAQALCNGYYENNDTSDSTVGERLDQIHITENGTQEHSNHLSTEARESPSTTSETDRDEEGWEVVRRSKRREQK